MKSPKTTHTHTHTHENMKTTFQVRYNKTKIDCETLEEAKVEASKLVDPSMPWDAKIVEIDEECEFIGTVAN